MKTKSLKFLSLILIGVFFMIFMYSLFFKIPSIILLPLTFLIILIFIFFTVVLFKEKNNYLNLIPKLLLALSIGFIIGRIILIPQNKYNREKAIELIAEIESFNVKNKRNPNINEIKLPKAVNGISISNFDYFFMDSKNQVYYVRYSNGFWDDYVYNSLSKTWFLDD